MTDQEIVDFLWQRIVESAGTDHSGCGEFYECPAPIEQMRVVAANHGMEIEADANYSVTFHGYISLICPKCSHHIGQFQAWDDHGTIEMSHSCGQVVLINGQDLSFPHSHGAYWERGSLTMKAGMGKPRCHLTDERKAQLRKMVTEAFKAMDENYQRVDGHNLIHLDADSKSIEVRDDAMRQWGEDGTYKTVTLAFPDYPEEIEIDEEQDYIDEVERELGYHYRDSRYTFNWVATHTSDPKWNEENKAIMFTCVIPDKMESVKLAKVDTYMKEQYNATRRSEPVRGEDNTYYLHYTGGGTGERDWVVEYDPEEPDGPVDINESVDCIHLD